MTIRCSFRPVLSRRFSLRGLITLTGSQRTRPADPSQHCHRSVQPTAVGFSTDQSLLSLRFDDVLSESNRLRCRGLLRKDDEDPVDVQQIPFFGGRSAEGMMPAAVLVPLCLVDGKPSVLFLLRSDHVPTHKGQVSFPGGRIDKNETIIDAALRETEEEIGLKKETIEVLGTMLPLPSRNFEFVVTPVVGYCGTIDLAKLEFNQDEVSDVFAASIESLCCKRNIKSVSYKETRKALLPEFVGQKHKIWGITAFFLHATLEIAAPGLYNYDVQFLS